VGRSAPVARLAGVAVAGGGDPEAARCGGGAGAQLARAEGVERHGRSGGCTAGASRRVAAGNEEAQVET
jgi:hypothetical protein